MSSVSSQSLGDGRSNRTNLFLLTNKPIDINVKLEFALIQITPDRSDISKVTNKHASDIISRFCLLHCYIMITQQRSIYLGNRACRFARSGDLCLCRAQDPTLRKRLNRFYFHSTRIEIRDVIAVACKRASHIALQAATTKTRRQYDIA